MSDPWFKFFPSDWRSDPRLRMCGAAARGLWIEMMSLMHEAQPYGHLLVSGQPPTDAQLAVLAGIPSDQLPDLIGELELAGVFSRTRAGVVYSRRMTRDEKKRRTARKNGKNGGNPSLGKDKENPASDNPPVKPQKPEARSQSKKETAKAVSKNRGTRLPEDWVLPKAWGDWALASTQLSAEQIRIEAQTFRNHWVAKPGKDATKLDWYATWQNWCHRARPQTPPKGGRNDGRTARILSMFSDTPLGAEGEPEVAGREGQDPARTLLAARPGRGR